MSGFEQCGIDVATQAIQIVHDTINHFSEDQASAVGDMVVLICHKVKHFPVDTSVSEIVHRAFHTVWDVRL